MALYEVMWRALSSGHEVNESGTSGSITSTSYAIYSVKRFTHHAQPGRVGLQDHSGAHAAVLSARMRSEDTVVGPH